MQGDIELVGVALLASVYEVALGFLTRDLPQRRVVVVQTPLASDRVYVIARVFRMWASRLQAAVLARTLSPMKS